MAEQATAKKLKSAKRAAAAAGQQKVHAVSEMARAVAAPQGSSAAAKPESGSAAAKPESSSAVAAPAAPQSSSGNSAAATQEQIQLAFRMAQSLNNGEEKES